MNNFRLILFFFFIQLFYFIHFSYAQVDDSTIQGEKIWLVKSIIQDEAKLWTSPLRYKKKDWLIAAPIISSTFFLIQYDESISKRIKELKLQHQGVKNVSPILSLGGDGKIAVPASVLLYAGGMIFKDTKLKQTGMLSMQAMLHAAIISQVLKMITSRQRPSAENGKDHWYWFPNYLKQFDNGYNGPACNSFPSGHTITVWSLATVIASQYKDQWIIPVLCYSTAILTGLSRITEDAHWSSDVLMGAALGYGIAKYIVNKRKMTKWLILPECSKNNLMVTMSYQF